MVFIVCLACARTRRRWPSASRLRIHVENVSEGLQGSDPELRCQLYMFFLVEKASRSLDNHATNIEVRAEGRAPERRQALIRCLTWRGQGLTLRLGGGEPLDQQRAQRHAQTLGYSNEEFMTERASRKVKVRLCESCELQGLGVRSVIKQG